MYILKYSEKNKQAEEIEERLREMSLAFKSEVVTGLQSIILAEGRVKIDGIKNITEYLDKLGGELHQWYYCNC